MMKVKFMCSVCFSIIFTWYASSILAERTDTFCDTIPPTATFDALSWELILPAVKMESAAGSVYALIFQGNPDFSFNIVEYCLLEVAEIPQDSATLTFPTGHINIPKLYAGALAYSAQLEIQNPTTPLTSESDILTQPITFVAPLAAIKPLIPKPDYPILLVHGLNSYAGKAWQFYIDQWQAEYQMRYGGTLSIEDKYHTFEPGNEANENRFRNTPLSFLYTIDVIGGNPTQGDFFALNFANNNDISFAAQGLQLREVIHQIIAWTGRSGVYIVAHSMGGLASRAYLQYFNDDKVKGLITISSPHLGTYVARLDILGIGGDIAKQLVVDSDDLKLLNDFARYPLPEAVHYFALMIRGFNTAGVDNLYSADEGDGIVPLWSQTVPGWAHQEIIIEEDEFLRIQVHTLATSAADVAKRVWEKLLSW